MTDYSDFSVEQFVLDEDFQEWVKSPNPQSIRFWRNWLAQHPDKEDHIRQARLIILSIDFKKTPVDEIPEDLMLKNIEKSIRKLDSRVGNRSVFSALSYKVAAVFLGLLISSAALYLSLDRGLQTYTTGYGEISHITLPDGSSVVLNANSSIQFDDWHQQGARKVRLEGEAFFKVVHTKNHQAFIVHTGAADIEVLGTEFNVKERRNTTEVVLSSGKVKLNTDKLSQEGMYMVPGELVQLAATGNVVRHEVVDPDQFSAWTNKELVFNGAPLSEIARTLEDNYGWKSKFEGDSIKYYRFTGTVSTASVADIELLLYSISEAFDIAVIKENNQITFRKVAKR